MCVCGRVDRETERERVRDIRYDQKEQLFHCVVYWFSIEFLCCKRVFRHMHEVLSFSFSLIVRKKRPIRRRNPLRFSINVSPNTTAARVKKTLWNSRKFSVRWTRYECKYGTAGRMTIIEWMKKRNKSNRHYNWPKSLVLPWCLFLRN